VRDSASRALLAVFAFTGCAGGGARGAGGPAPTARAFPPVFERMVSGIEVLDRDGRPLPHPFLGGLNVPRPQLVDVDRDGDLDLFIQERSGGLTYFERVGGPDELRYAWRTDRYQDLEIGEWFRFADIDGDGDYDLLAEERFSFIRYYRNDGRPGAPAFVLAADTLRATDGAPLFSDRQNIPNVVDIDCDGRLDLFIGRLIGTVSRYEAEATDEHGVPRFTLVTERFENIEIVAQIGSLHGANTLTFADVDADGDYDLFWGDFFEAGLLFIENTGPDCATPVLRGEPVKFPLDDPIETSGYNAPSFGDVDGDGDLDLLVGVIGGAYNPNRTTADNLRLFEQTAPGSFGLRSLRFAGAIDVGSESLPVFVDDDGDGDLDLWLANKIEPEAPSTGGMVRFENRGTAQRPAFAWSGTIDLGRAYHYAPAFGDLDGDGDLDLLLGNWRKDVQWFRQDGSPQRPDYVLVDSSVVSLTRGSNTTPALVDIDADGDLDLFVGEASGTINFYRNVGSTRVPAFELVSDEYLDIDVGRRSFPTFVDLDGDGDQDMVIGREAGGIVYYRNDGTARAPNFVLDESFNLPLDHFSTPVFVDLDGDGDLDVVAGGTGGGLLYFVNRTR